MKLDTLNEAQQRAVSYGSDGVERGALLIVAGAGSGKTATLAHRVAHLVERGADPQRLLLLTFSRRAAAELERRVDHVLRANRRDSSRDRPLALTWTGTFHSVAARVLRELADSVGLAQNFTVHDRGDSEELLGLVRHEHLADDATDTRFPSQGTCLAIYSRTVNAQQPLADILRDCYPWCAHLEQRLRVLFEGYVVAKQAHNVLDFDDLLLYWAGLMAEPALAAEVRSRFDHVLVDEYQDTNALQGSIVRLLKPDGRGVTVVGDDAQAIYGFRAATVRNILDFAGQYPEPAEVVTLERNYRSTQPILDASNAVIALARERYAKSLVTERTGGELPRLVSVQDESSQAEYVAQQVLAHREKGIDLRRQAVLFRTSSHSAQLELELTRRHIPYVKFGGLRFLDAAHVKDVLSVLRWIENPRARLAGFRALRLLPGVGPATATRWLAASEASASPLEAMNELSVPSAAQDEWSGLLALLRDLRASRWPADVDRVLDWYRRPLERQYDDAALRESDLEQLRRIAATYPTRERFLTELALDPPAAAGGRADTPLLDEDYLILSTIHSAKGQEWNAVHVLNCVDGCMPSDMARNSEEIEEERRLLYVAMTRAKEHLALLLPQRFYVRAQSPTGDRHVYAARSRFLTDEVCRRFEQSTWPVAPQSGATSARAAGTRIDIGAKLRAAWSQSGE